MIALFILNNIYLNIRISELNIYLQKSDHQESRVDHIQLIMKYNVSKKRYNKKITQDKADIIEHKIDSITSEKTSYDTVLYNHYKIFTIPALFIININRFLIGKEPIQDLRTENTLSYLEIAYFYERNNFYKKALVNYKKALECNLSNKSIKGSIMLHQGFCHALLGNSEKAKILYHKIIKEFSSRQIAITATVLLNYLKGFNNELEKNSKRKD